MMFVIANPSPSVILTLTLNEVKGKGKNLKIPLRVNSVKSRFIGTTGFALATTLQVDCHGSASQ